MLYTGSDQFFWFGSCPEGDPIRIGRKKFNLPGKDPEKGAFYRVKLSRGRDGAWKVIDFNAQQVYPRDIEVKIQGGKNILVCILFEC